MSYENALFSAVSKSFLLGCLKSVWILQGMGITADTGSEKALSIVFAPTAVTQ